MRIGQWGIARCKLVIMENLVVSVLRPLMVLVCTLMCFLPAVQSRAGVTPGSGNAGDWNVAVLDQLLAGVPVGQPEVQVGDQLIQVGILQNWRDQLAGNPSPQLAFNSGFTQWTNGNVYYTFDSSVPVPDQRVFLSAAGQWSTFVNVHFLPRTSQPNYLILTNNPNLSGGLSSVGMIGGPQLIQIGTNSWSEQTLVHEIGHALGLVHEHQRSDRDSYVSINTNNVAPGALFNFVLLPGSLNKGAYDFRSVMEYSRNAFSVSANSNTIVPLPAYTSYLYVIGNSEPPLSTNDRAGVITVYGAGPGYSSVVTNTQDSGPGSLRSALYYASDHPGTTVTFNIPATDPGLSNNVFNILPADYLPGLYGNTTIDGTTEPVIVNSAGPQILLNGAYCWALGDYASGLQFKGANSTIRGLIINGFPYCGVNITGSNAIGNTVSGCYLGLDRTGSTAVTNWYVPVQITAGACSNVIGGVTASARNIISGSAYQGIYLTGTGTCFNVVAGNYLGLNAAGTAAISNLFAGVEISGGAKSNLVGGAVAGARNVIAGNNAGGVSIAGTNTSGNVVAGNYIGLNAAGTAAVANNGSGVQLFNGTTGNVIGGTQAGAGNVISGNTYQGIQIDAQPLPTSHTCVQGNWVGLNGAGTGAIPNLNGGIGIYDGAYSNLIGGTLTAARNVVSGNGAQGVIIGNSSSFGNVVAGNYIGLNPAGTAALPNALAGVNLFVAVSNVIGGAIAGAGNVISGNGAQGILIQNAGTVGNLVQGNLIGLNAAGTTQISNSWSGIELYNGPAGSQIGGAGAARNFISGNGEYGVIVDYASSLNVIQGNTIGLNISNTVAVPNGWTGVSFYSGATFNLLGGTTYGAANLIAGNTMGGVVVEFSGATNNTIRGNSIYSNNSAVYPGITLYSAGNNLISAPTLTSAVVTTNLTVSGNYKGTNGWAYQLDFYSDAPGLIPEGRTYLGAFPFTGTGSSASFTASLRVVTTNGRAITATITDPAGNTSPFSTAVAATMTSSVNDGIPDAWRAAYFGGSGTTTNSQSTAGGDADHTGLTNFQKFLAGLNPTNSASGFWVYMASPIATTNAVVLRTTSGTVYQAQYRDSLTAGSWQILADQILGNGTNIHLPDPGAASTSSRFYRALVEY